jgi:glyoxylase-like metal-dependent hydrolase (beta-lactamase superfamily II)
MKCWPKIAIGGAVVLGAGAGLLMPHIPPAGPARIQLEPRVVGVMQGISYVWLVRTASGAFAIDTGWSDDIEPLTRELKAWGLGLDDVHTVFITHAHQDHTKAAHLFQKAEIFIGPGDLAMVRGERRPGGWMSRFLLAVFPAVVVPPNMKEHRGDDSFLAGGAMVRAVHVPGHTPGSTVYLFDDILFTGDALLVGDGDHFMTTTHAFADDVAQNRRSLERLRELPFARVADGHTGAASGAKAKLERFLAAAP